MTQYTIEDADKLLELQKEDERAFAKVRAGCSRDEEDQSIRIREQYEHAVDNALPALIAAWKADRERLEELERENKSMKELERKRWENVPVEMRPFS